MTSSDGPLHPALVVALLVLSATAAFAFPAAGSHGAENGNYTVDLPNEEDHYPADEGGLASINHLAAATDEAFVDVGAPNEINMHFITITNDAIDYTECSTEDTRAFAIDEGNNDSGTSTTPGEDTDLVRYRESAYFKSDRITVEFYTEDDAENNPAAPSDAPPTVHPIDEIVAAQDSCYYMPEDPGWYQINGKLNGTNADGDFVRLTMPSHYFYICRCANEEEARDELGPPPSEREATPTPTPTPGPGTPTPTPTATPTPTPTPTATPTGTATPTPTAANTGGGGATTTPTPATGDGATATPTRERGDLVTPTVGSGPGFGPTAAVMALIVGALLALRRR